MNIDSRIHERSITYHGIYRTHDPIAHFTVRIKVWRPGIIVNPETVESPEESATKQRRRKRTASAGGRSLDFSRDFQNIQTQKCDTLRVKWQEKILSWGEVLRYGSQAGPEAAKSDSSYYALAQKRLEKAGSNFTQLIFTYVDQDVECDAFRRKNQYSSPLLKSIPKSNIVSSKDHSLSESSRESDDSSTREELMLIMADFSPRNTDESRVTPVLLCAVSFDPRRKVISVKPDFSSSGEYYPVKSPSGELFHYCLELESHLKSPLEILKDSRLLNEVCRHHHEGISSITGEEFEKPLNPDHCRFHFHGLILDACKFNARWISVRYLLNAPEGWKSNEEIVYGATQWSSVSSRGKAQFCLPISADLSFNSSYECRAPRLFFQVMSLDWWGCQRTEGYGWIAVPLTPGRYDVTVKTWRVLFPTFQAEMRRFFLAASTPFADVRAIVDPSLNGSKAHCWSRYGFQTITAGEIRLQLDVVTQESSFGLSLLTSRAGVDDALHKSIEIVLEAFRKARSRMYEARLKLNQTVVE
ncbi:unnamed protein product [Notodromas monacha]|uniref:Meckel syndrome type 1 protein n=1 Tax=Notodromas monacha TaxID=399045 RepID=A0A7R9GCB6_9CRUS|nr:unnamed protein product [Notodromas monacha]CAG0915807.1 unnamed protein product [Notodromas monacha]